MVEESLGPTNFDVATSLNNLAGLYCKQGSYAKAELLSRRSMEILQAFAGNEHPEVATALGNLGTLLVDLGRYENGEQMLRKSLELSNGSWGRITSASQPASTTWLGRIESVGGT